MAVEQGLAQLSNSLVYSAMLVYTGALGAFVADLAQRGGRVEAVRSESARLEEPVLVGADAAAPAASQGSGAAGVPSTGREPWRGRAAGIAVALTWLAFGLHAAAVLTRGASVHRAPWGNMFEFATTGAVVVTGVYLAVLSRRDIRYLGTFVVGPVLLTLGLAVTVFYTEAAQLVPALRSFWLLIHVSVAFVASALFTLGFSTTVLQLIQERRESARAAGREPGRGRFMDALPDSVELEQSSYRIHIAAFPLWGFTLIAGAIWAEAAWGKYWNWDPKETWTFVIWVVYAAYLHARATRGWDGRRAAYLSMLGYACLLANFLLVNFFAVGMHTYAK
jgi:cytochrome c-type biogenesis protein CcsB